MSFADELRAHIETACGVSQRFVDHQTALFSTGLLDSFTLIDIIGFLEEKTGIDVRPRDVHFGNFDSVSAIVNYVEGLRPS